MRRQHWVIPIANEMGYYPTARQASEINCRNRWRLRTDRFGGDHPREWSLDDPIFLADLRTAIREVMNAPKKTRTKRPRLEIVRI